MYIYLKSLLLFSLAHFLETLRLRVFNNFEIKKSFEA